MLMFEHSCVRNALTNNIERSPTLASFSGSLLLKIVPYQFCSFTLDVVHFVVVSFSRFVQQLS